MLRYQIIKIEQKYLSKKNFALNIIDANEDIETKSIKKCDVENYWPKNEAVQAKLIFWHKVFRHVFRTLEI